MLARFAELPRGRVLPGADAIARYIWGKGNMSRSVYGLPRDRYGLIVLGGKLTGFSKWIDAALAAEASAGRKRRRRRERVKVDRRRNRATQIAAESRT